MEGVQGKTPIIEFLNYQNHMFFLNQKDVSGYSDELKGFIEEVNKFTRNGLVIEIGLLTTPMSVKDAQNIYKMSLIKEDFKVNLFEQNKSLQETEINIEKFIKQSQVDDTNFINTIRLSILRNGQSILESSIFIGFVGLLPAYNMMDTLLLGSRHQLLFSILPEFRNNGFMKHALKMTMNEMYDMGYNICAAIIFNGNIASERLLLSAGFVANGRQQNDSKGYLKRLNMPPSDFNNLIE